MYLYLWSFGGKIANIVMGTVYPEVEKIGFIRDAKWGKKCEEENPHPVKAASYLWTAV